MRICFARGTCRWPGTGWECRASAPSSPVVASRVGGLQSTIVDSVTGFPVPRDHSEDIARRIRQVLDSSELRERLDSPAARAVCGGRD
jgi:glycosyltransferase involved in cell wall biosynthesis